MCEPTARLVLHFVPQRALCEFTPVRVELSETHSTHVSSCVLLCAVVLLSCFS